MSDLLDEKEIIKLERYLRREGREDFVTEMHGASPQQLDSKMLSLAKHAEEIQTTRDDDQKLREAKSEVKVLAAPYNDQKKMNKKMNRFVALLMKEKGVQ